MKDIQSISVIDILHHNNLVTRESAIALLSKVSDNSCSSINLDFSGIYFISRSFADQFHKIKMELKTNESKEIIVTNAGNEVIQMLSAVSRTQSSKDRFSQESLQIHFENRKEFKAFLLAL